MYVFTGHGKLSFPLINKVLFVIGSELYLKSGCSIHYKLGGSGGHAPPGELNFLEAEIFNFRAFW